MSLVYGYIPRLLAMNIIADLWTFCCYYVLHLCRIDANFLIKITDFGLSEDVFERNYFKQGSSEEVVKLPVKWMTPESLSDGHFSEKSDVVCS